MAVDQPPRANTTDIAQASNPAVNDIDALIAQADAVVGDSSFSEGLAARRDNLSRLTGNTQAIQSFQESPEYKQNLQAIQSNRVAGERPSDLLRSAMGVEQGSRSALEESLSRTTAGLNALTQFLGLAQSRVEQAQEFENRKLQQQRENLKFKLEYGVDPVTGEPATLEDTYVTPDGLPLNDEQKKSARLKGQDAVLEVKRQAGDLWKILTRGVSVKDIPELAEKILQQGGVSEFRKTADLASLMTEEELLEDGKIADIKGSLDLAKAMFETRTGGPGTGTISDLPVVGWLVDVFSPDTRELKAQAEKIKTAYAQMISGKVISDREIERLKRFLPDPKKTEAQNLQDIDRLKKEIDLNLKLFERGKREGLTANEAYDKYGAEYLDVSGEQSNEKEEARSKLKAAGYTDEQIEQYFQARGL